MAQILAVNGRKASIRVPQRARYGLAAALALIAILIPAWGGFLFSTFEVDFRYYWFAGHMWAHGMDPYTPAYAEWGNRVLPLGSQLHVWPYPPNWWPVCVAFALFDYHTALIVWRFIASALMLASTAYLIWALTPRLDLPRRLLWAALACILASAIEPARIMLGGAQVSPVAVYVGFVLLVGWYATQSRGLLVAGLMLTALKPQVGALAFVAFLIVDFRAVLYATIGSLALAMPQLIAFGSLNTLLEMLRGLQSYPATPANTALAMTGPAHLLGRLGIALPAMASYPLAIASSIGAGFLMRRHALGGFSLLLAGIAAFVPFHSYDMSILLIVAIVLLKNAPALRIPVILTSLLVVKPEFLERGLPVYADASQGVLCYSIAALVFFGLAVGTFLGMRHSRAPVDLVGHHS